MNLQRIQRHTAIRKENGHFPNALVELDVALHVADLIDGELNYTAIAILGCSLLPRYVEISLSLDSSLLDLDQDLSATGAYGDELEAAECCKYENLSQSVIR